MMKYFTVSFIVILGINMLSDNALALEAENIIGGSLARKYQIKYYVSLQRDGYYRCGGGIVKDDFILTAAHCVVNAVTGHLMQNHFAVVVPNINILTLNRSSVVIDVEKVFVPKIYQPVNVLPYFPYRPEGDLAVLKLKHGMGLGHNPHLKQLQLPLESFCHLRKTLIIAGQGYNKIRLKRNAQKGLEETGKGDGLLRYSVAKGISNEECNKLHVNPIYETHLCASVALRKTCTLRGTCTGDSGSPLVYKGGIVLGVLSRSPAGCNEYKRPAVYTRVSSYLKFITNAIQNKKIPGMFVATWTKISSFPLFYQFIADH